MPQILVPIKKVLDGQGRPIQKAYATVDGVPMPITRAWVVKSEPLGVFKFVIRINIGGNYLNYIFGKHNLNYATVINDYTVDWGDGSPDEPVYILPGQPCAVRHMYPAVGEYEITLKNYKSGDCGFNYQYAEINKGIIKVLTPFPKGMTFSWIPSYNDPTKQMPWLNGRLFTTAMLETLPDRLFCNIDYPEIYFDSCFLDGTALKALPPGLFDGMTAHPITFSNMFNRCRNMTGAAIPLWDMFPNAIAYYNCYRDCTSLSNYATIPAGWKSL